MKISTKGRYSLRMLLDLAEHGEGFVALSDIARRQGISKKYLEQLVPLLSSGGFLRANRGALGGYMLAKAPDQYTVGQVLRAAEGGLCLIACLEDRPIPCGRSASCKTLPMWQGLQKVMDEYLDGITLQAILDASAQANGQS